MNCVIFSPRGIDVDWANVLKHNPARRAHNRYHAALRAGGSFTSV